MVARRVVFEVAMTIRATDEPEFDARLERMRHLLSWPSSERLNDARKEHAAYCANTVAVVNDYLEESL